MLLRSSAGGEQPCQEDTQQEEQEIEEEEEEGASPVPAPEAGAEHKLARGLRVMTSGVENLMREVQGLPGVSGVVDRIQDLMQR